jgi:hypothetical protein
MYDLSETPPKKPGGLKIYDGMEALIRELINY